MATVLCISIEDAVITKCKYILKEAGHTVVTAMSSPEIIAACHDFKFDVAVVGESGHSQTSQEWAAVIRERCPGVKIVEVSSPHLGVCVPSSDARLAPAEVPAKLAERVAEVSKKDAPARNTEQIRELCVEVLKAEKGASFEAAIRKLADAMEDYAQEKGRDKASQAG